MAGVFTLEPAKVFWQKLAVILKEQADVIERVFPPTVNVMLPFVERVAEDVISEYITPLLDEAHDRGIEKYLKAVSGLLKQSMDFGASLAPILSKSSAGNPMEDVMGVLMRVFDAHVDLYLQEELDFVKSKFSQEVETWEQIVTEQETATESFFMSNINREADKRDFLSTFKKVILAPVSVIPSAFTTAKTPDVKAAETNPNISSLDPSNNRFSVAGSSEDYFQQNNARNSARLSVPGGTSGRASPALSSVLTAPTTELAAKAAIMNSKLQGISTLFSLDVALKLVHMAKESLERAAVFAKVGGQTGEEAYESSTTSWIRTDIFPAASNANPSSWRSSKSLAHGTSKQVSIKLLTT
jgi:recyclin-1